MLIKWRCVVYCTYTGRGTTRALSANWASNTYRDLNFRWELHGKRKPANTDCAAILDLEIRDSPLYFNINGVHGLSENGASFLIPHKPLPWSPWRRSNQILSYWLPKPTLRIIPYRRSWLPQQPNYQFFPEILREADLNLFWIKLLVELFIEGWDQRSRRSTRHCIKRNNQSLTICEIRSTQKTRNRHSETKEGN